MDEVFVLGAVVQVCPFLVIIESNLLFCCYFYFQTRVFLLEKLMTLCSWMSHHRRT